MPPQFENMKLHILNVNSSQMFDKVRQHAAPVLGKFIFGYVVLMLFLDYVPQAMSLVYTPTTADLIMAVNHNIPKSYLADMPQIPLAFYIFAFLFNGAFKMGEALYSLTCIRNRKVEFTALIEGFKFYFKAFGLFLCKTFIIGIGLMLFIIPGILYALNFSQAYYILADNPEKGIFTCLAESKIRMSGNRVTYITSLMTFILIALAMYFVTAVISGFMKIDLNTMNGIIMYLTANIPFYCATGLLVLGQGTFYELLLEGDFCNFKYAGQDTFRNNNELRNEASFTVLDENDDYDDKTDDGGNI